MTTILNVHFQDMKEEVLEQAKQVSALSHILWPSFKKATQLTLKELDRRS
jgi:hypothetical protein